jgi:hypothetical protein
MLMFDEQRKEAFRQTLRAMPGYPWLPCPICKVTESCEHIAAERARASGMSFGTDTRQ